MKKLDPERVQRIEKLLEQGYTRAQIAKIMRLDWSTVADYAAEWSKRREADRNAPVQQPVQLDTPDAPPRR